MEVIERDPGLLVRVRERRLELGSGGGACLRHRRRVGLLRLRRQGGALLLQRSLHLRGGDGEGGLLIRRGVGAEGRFERAHSLALVALRGCERGGHLRRELLLEGGDGLGVGGGGGGERALLVGASGRLGLGDGGGARGGGGCAVDLSAAAAARRRRVPP